MSTKKKQHYTPSFILRGFADDDHTLWVWDKTQGSCRPVKGTRSKGREHRYDALFENNYNTIVDRDGNRDLAVEDYLANVEAAAAPVIADVVDAARRGFYHRPGFAKFEDLARFLWAQTIRSPYIRAYSINSEESHQMFRDTTLEAATSLGVDPGQIIAKYDDSSTLLEAASKRAIMIEEYPRCAVDCMRRMSLDLLKIPRAANAHFITSDGPCFIRPVLQPGGMAFMALTREVAVQFSRPEDSNGVLQSVGMDTVEALNKRNFESATRFVAGPSRDYLEALACG